jgi:protease I
MGMTKKVVLVVASKGFQQEEYNETHKVLLKAGIEVTTASDKLGLAVAHDGSTVKVDVSLDALQPAQFDGIFLIGGRGAIKNKCLDTPVMYRILNEAFALGKAYGAICISPRILAQAQVLRGKKATCWNDDQGTQEVFSAGGVTLVPEAVVVDGKVVTANGPQAAVAFGNAIVTVV